MSLFCLIRGRVCSLKIDREIHAGYSSLRSVVALASCSPFLQTTTGLAGQTAGGGGGGGGGALCNACVVSARSQLLNLATIG